MRYVSLSAEFSSLVDDENATADEWQSLARRFDVAADDATTRFDSEACSHRAELCREFARDAAQKILIEAEAAQMEVA